MIEFKKFQEKSIQELVLITSQLLNRSEKNSICVFQSPTGSGKTLMTGQFIKDLIRENAAVDLCFLWVSIGKGELHVQSKEKLESFFAGAPTCSLVEQEFTGQRSEIEKNEVVFVNWEKLRNKDRQSGKWSNALMKDGEQVSFPEVLHHTRKKRKLVMIIDESHYGTSTERAHELKEIIDADVLLHVSATPSYIPNGLEISQKKAGYVFVNPMDVIEEGLIKKEVIINENLDRLATDETELTSLEAVIKAAVHKRTELKRSYEMENSAVNPLILVQIPNSDQGDEQLAAVTSILKEYGLEEKNDKLAIWVSGYKSDILHARNIAEQDHPVECLIFKQAIDTGWDCPRAQILVKLREVRSETFEIQTVGRILRMPEQRHYLSQENLNKAYIYTNIESIVIKKEDYHPNLIKDLKSLLRTDIEHTLHLSSYYRSRTDYGSLTREFYQTLENVALQRLGLPSDSIDHAANIKELETQGFDFSFDFQPHLLDFDVSIGSENIDQGFTDVRDQKDKAEFKYNDQDIHTVFEHHIRSHLGPFAPKRSLSPARMAIYRFFKKYLGSDQWENELNTIQVVYLKNREKWGSIFLDAIEQHKSIHAEYVNEKTVENHIPDYNLPEFLYHNKHTEEIVPFTRYAYSPCYLDVDRRNTERKFEEYIDVHDQILWWWKNGKNKRDYLGIKYEYENTIHTFYPDYIVKTKDGKTAILEVKDVNDQEGNTKTKAKAQALYRYLLHENNRPDAIASIVGGIIVFHNGRWILNQQEHYTWTKTIADDWSDWVDLDHIL